MKLGKCRFCLKDKPVIQHHYPLTEEFGGTTTIPVCRTCHRHDHELFDRLVNEVKRGDMQIDLQGLDPHADRRSKIKAVLDYQRSQKCLSL